MQSHTDAHSCPCCGREVFEGTQWSGWIDKHRSVVGCCSRECLDALAHEDWTPVVGFVGKYEVSTAGRVRNVPDRRILKQTSGCGRAKNYKRVMLHNPGYRKGKRHAYVHHLVAEAWIGPRPEGALACHRNDCGQDNRLANIYYGSKEDNECDKYVNSLPLNTMQEAPF